MSHISDPPIFSSTCIHTCLYRKFVLVREDFCSGVCLGSFVWKVSSGVVFVRPPLLSEYIHYNRKLDITFNFRFHMYEMFLKNITSHTLGLPPPSSVMYFMDGLLPMLFTISY